MCSVSLEWPPLASLVAKAQEPRGCLKRLSDTVRQVFNIANVTNPEDEGVIDHMISVTTAMRSPFIAVACHTVSHKALDPFLTPPHPLLLQLDLPGLQIITLCPPFLQSEDIRDYFLVFVWSHTFLILLQKPEAAPLTFVCFGISLNMTFVWNRPIVV